MSLTEQQRSDRRRGYERKYHDNPANRGKHYARGAVFKALERGDLVRASSCERCGACSDIEAHHGDYSKPLEVEWLCVKCHSTHHHKTHCKQGHELSDNNVYVDAKSGNRACRACRTLAVQRFRGRYFTEQITGAAVASVRKAKALVEQAAREASVTHTHPTDPPQG